MSGAAPFEVLAVMGQRDLSATSQTRALRLMGSGFGCSAALEIAGQVLLRYGFLASGTL